MPLRLPKTACGAAPGYVSANDLINFGSTSVDLSKFQFPQKKLGKDIIDSKSYGYDFVFVWKSD